LGRNSQGLKEKNRIKKELENWKGTPKFRSRAGGKGDVLLYGDRKKRKSAERKIFQKKRTMRKKKKKMTGKR